MFKILIVEDDKSIREELKLLLENNGYEVAVISNFSNTYEQIKEFKYDLMLLDVNLPVENGFKLCMKIRAFSQVPIIFVTSRNTDLDELQSITLGGDDFISKPYNIPILLARISSLLKRTYANKSVTKLNHKNVILDLEKSKISFGEKSEELTKNEFKILLYLFKNSEKIVPRADIIDYLWDNEIFIDDNALSVNIARIRNKLEVLGVSNFIQTKHRQGYII